MKALIQHNFVSGMGDFLNCIYEYFITANKLKQLGYTEFMLYLYLDKNIYIDRDDFWNVFNKNEFEKLFMIEIINEPILLKQYEIYTYIGTVGVNRPGQHQWDLFLENPTNESIDCFSTYSYTKPDSDYIELFSSQIMNHYEKKTNYVSIYFRGEDLNEDNWFLKKSEEIKKVIQNASLQNKKVFVCSNSYEFKKYMKQYDVFTHDIPMEETIGNHYTYGNKLCYNNKDIFKERTKYILLDMLTLSDSSDIYFFTTYSRSTNFLVLSLIKNVPIHYI